MSTLEDAIGGVMTNLAGAGLSLDPAMQQRLSALEGRVVELVSETPDLVFYLSVMEGELRLSGTVDGAPNVSVRGPGIDIARWLTNPERTEGVEINGDQAVLLEISDALSAFEPELTAPLTNLLGSDATQTMLGTAEMAVAALRSAAEGVGSALEQTAASRFVTKEDTSQLLDTLDDLRLRIDRLAARVKAQEDRPE